MEIKQLWDPDHDCACPPGWTPRLPPEHAWPARGSWRVSEPRAQWVRRNGRALSRGGQQGATTGPTRLQPDCSAPNESPLRGGRLRFHFTSAVPAWPYECACVRASRSGSSSDKARSSAGPGVRGAPGRRAAGSGRWGGAERRRRRREQTSASWADRDAPLTSSSVPSPPALPPVALSSLRDQAPALRRESASRSSLREARGALLRAPRVSLPQPGERRCCC
ncbi:uncharacterized protein LOC141567210 isoform X2 [Rhinolophus sinicus]|uniref:uncharacterized protein LOC141567210 isoform X2 n=1 Tax=Rhinolophus sinicus TaxID=89399 RepID=UPI003D7ACB5B